MYGSMEFMARRRRANIFWRIPRGDLYTTAAPRLVVNTHVKDIEVQEVDVYEMISEIEEGGTCVVYVPDIMVLLALDSFSDRTGLRFSEACYPTYLCHSLKEYLKQLAQAEAEMYRRWGRLGEKFIPPGIVDAPSEPPPWMKVKECTTIGSPYVAAVWDYFLGYPPGLSPQELATLLREKKLKFVKVLPKIEPIENPCKNVC